ncbi:MAG: glycosyltransferase family 87 protein [Thermohalobaculum sp.]|nr:glycosyltransferase family 87 protein [Thermohalobaculum sp.]
MSRPALIAGAEAWKGFGTAPARQAALVGHGNLRLHQRLGSYPVLLTTGLAHDAAMTAQLRAILPRGIVVAMIWRRRSIASIDARAAMRCLRASVTTLCAHLSDAPRPAPGARLPAPLDRAGRHRQAWPSARTGASMIKRLKTAAPLATLFVAIVWFGVLIRKILENAAILAGDPGAASVALDVSAFWSAARLMLDGMPTAAFDAEAMARVQANTGVGRGYALQWLYPPALLVLLAPLGMLNFIAAWIALMSVSLVAFHAALRRLLPSWRMITLLTLLSPATLICALAGQLTMLFAAAALFGFAALMRGHDVRGGVWLALVTLKPQLGLAFPVALIASRSWRLLGIGTAMILLLTLAPLPLVGTDYWARWFDAVSVHDDVARHFVRYDLYFMTWRHLFALAGLGGAAPVLGWGMTLAIIAAVALGWRRPAAPIDLRAALLLFAMIGALPFAFLYEVLFALTGSVVLLRAAWSPDGGAAGHAWARPFSAAVFGALWFGPLLPMAEAAPAAFVVLPPTLVGLIGTLVLIRRAGAAQAAPAVPL